MLIFLIFLLGLCIAAAVIFFNGGKQRAGEVAALVGGMLFLVVLGVYASGTSNGGPTPSASSTAISQSTEMPEQTSEPTETPEPTPNNHDAREAAQEYWTRVMNEMALAGAAISAAGTEMQSGDSVSAQQLLSRAEDAADAASQATLDNPPDGDTWSTIGGELMDAANTYKTAIQEFKDGLANDDSEKLAGALDDASNAGDSLQEATHDAREWYIENGGQATDLEDYPTAEHDAESLLNDFTQ